MGAAFCRHLFHLASNCGWPYIVQKRHKFQIFHPALDATGVLSFDDENSFNLNDVGYIISYLMFLRNHTGPALPTHTFLFLPCQHIHSCHCNCDFPLFAVLLKSNLFTDLSTQNTTGNGSSNSHAQGTTALQLNVF
jgi:hypothetical protein